MVAGVVLTPSEVLSPEAGVLKTTGEVAGEGETVPAGLVAFKDSVGLEPGVLRGVVSTPAEVLVFSTAGEVAGVDWADLVYGLVLTMAEVLDSPTGVDLADLVAGVVSTPAEVLDSLIGADLVAGVVVALWASEVVVTTWVF